MFFERTAFQSLEKWIANKERKPLILRGARQVGKTFLAREFAKRKMSHVLEINFERQPRLKEIFKFDLDPFRILSELQVHLGKKLPIEKSSLLFFDEIQECPAALKALRYFYEEIPHLPVIATGSLLDFVIEEIGIPVGRVSFLHLYPFSFFEFLSAMDFQELRRYLEDPKSLEKPNNNLYEVTLRAFVNYIIVGGLPEAVLKWKQTKDFLEVKEVHQTLIQSYQQDFHKYTSTKKIKYVDLVFRSIPRLLGQKFVFRNVSDEFSARELKEALFLLEKSKIAHIVYHTSANGIPLGSEIDPKRFKVLFIDIGLALTLMNFDISLLISNPLENLINKGEIVEALCGQELIAYSNPSEKKELYYWLREAKNAQAEVDYLLQIESEIIPCEVKSGKSSRTKSLQIFLEEKKRPSGVLLSIKNEFEVKKKSDKKLIIFPVFRIQVLNQMLSEMNYWNE